MTGSLPNLIERIVSKNIEKAIQRTTAEFSEGKFSPEALKGLGKNIDIEKLKGQALKNLGGGEIAGKDNRQMNIKVRKTL